MLKNQILTAPDLKPPHPVECPEWGCVVHVRHLDAGGRAKLGRLVQAQPVPLDADAQAVVLMAVHEDGSPVFTDADVSALMNKNAEALHRLVHAGLAYNGFPMSKAVDEAKKD